MMDSSGGVRKGFSACMRLWHDNVTGRAGGENAAFHAQLYLRIAMTPSGMIGDENVGLYSMTFLSSACLNTMFWRRNRNRLESMRSANARPRLGPKLDGDHQEHNQHDN